MSDARARLEALATDLGKRAGISGLESGDYDTYKENFADEEESPDVCLAEDYWEAEYEELMEEGIQALSAEEQAVLAGQDDLREALRSLYGTAFATAVKS